MNAQEAIRRIHGQSPQELKIARANIIINNSGSFTNTWKQVAAAWKVILPAYVTKPEVMGKGVTADVSIQRGLPRDSARIAAFISRLNGSAPPLSSEDIMSAFGDKAFLLLMSGNQLVGLAGWQVENLVSRTTELFLDPRIPMAKGLKNLVTEVERASRDLQCEASLLFLPPQLAAHKEIWNEMGYSPHDPLTLGVSAWRAAAKESQPVNTILLIKQLRQDRVLRPI